MALDPDVLFFDEPSAGLDPISSRPLDDLILELRASLGATIVVVTHELANIFSIANNSVFLERALLDGEACDPQRIDGVGLCPLQVLLGKAPRPQRVE
jgi:phospholipid/cholesterol/gamma-HCH transport system ATP-binding protein